MSPTTYIRGPCMTDKHSLPLLERDDSCSTRDGPVILCLCIFGLLAFLATPAHAQQQDVFQLQVCNRSTFQAWFAFVSRESPQSSAFVIQGWFPVDPGPCRPTWSFSKGWFFYYAEDSTRRRTWPGQAGTFCIRRPDKWMAKVPSTNYSCQSNESPQGFNGQEVNSPALIVTLN